MKSVFLLLLLFTNAIVNAQTTPPNERAKTFYDKFLKIVEDIKKKDAENADNETVVLKMLADNAMQQVEHIKKRDPKYDVKQLEAIVQPYIGAQKAAIQAHNDKVSAKIKQSDPSGDGCGSLFMATTTVEVRNEGNIEEDIRKHIQQIQVYNEKLNRILSTNMAGVEACEDYLRSTAASEKTQIQRFFKDAQSEHANSVKTAYRELVGREAYWNAAQKIYPKMIEASEVYKTAKDALALLGSMDDAVAKANKKRQERLKNLFMPKAVVVNAALEAEFKEAFANEGWGEMIIKIHILTREWETLRNSLTSAIIGRTQSAAIVAKQKQGNCILYLFTIKQQYTGIGYSNLSSRYSHSVVENEFLCENAK